MERTFSVAEARALMPDLRENAARIVDMRADLADARRAMQRGGEPPGGIPKVKALEAHLQEAVDWFATRGIQVKGIAPLLADFPAELDDEPVLLCWLEGETSLEWYHPRETGFMGRRRIPDDL